jgi:hypothetical protein
MEAPWSFLEAGNRTCPFPSLTTEVVIVEPALLALTRTLSNGPSLAELTWAVTAAGAGVAVWRPGDSATIRRETRGFIGTSVCERALSAGAT